MGHGGQIAQAHQHSVTKWAGHKLLAWLDQGDCQIRVSKAQILGTGRSAEATPHDDDARWRLRPRPTGAYPGQGQAAEETQHVSTRQHMHGTSPTLAARLAPPQRLGRVAK